MASHYAVLSSSGGFDEESIMELGGRAGRLRERPPRWPWRDDEEVGPDPRRWERERELFEENAHPELYPGALVMEDLVAAADELATMRVLARYTVVRTLMLAAAGTIAGSTLRDERRIAQEHLALLPSHDWERRALERILDLLHMSSSAPELVDAVIIAAEAAGKRSHVMGCFALYRTGYELACARGWWSHAAQAARGIGRIAQLEEARYSTRLWERRAAVLERRALRDLEAADEESSDAAEPTADGGSAQSADGEAAGS